MAPDGRNSIVGRRGDPAPSLLDGVRVRVDDHWPTVVAALLVVALVGGWVTYAAYVAPVTEERVAGAVDGGGSYTYGATVQRDNPVYPVGTRLTDRRHFVAGVTPTLNGTYTHEYDATDVANVRVETTLSLRLRSVDGDAVYWETTDRLGVDHAEGAAGTVAVPFSVDVEALAARADRIEREVGGTPGSVEATLVARTATTGTSEERSLRGVETAALPIELSGNTYRVGDVDRSVDSRAVALTRGTARGSGDPASRLGGPLALLTGVIGAAGLGVAGLFGLIAPPSAVRSAVRARRTRRELDEWITRGRVPRELRSGPLVEADSLGGLVDVAIDGDERVVEDVEAGAYFVVDGATVYVHRPGGSWVSATSREPIDDE